MPPEQDPIHGLQAYPGGDSGAGARSLWTTPEVTICLAADTAAAVARGGPRLRHLPSSRPEARPRETPIPPAVSIVCPGGRRNGGAGGLAGSSVGAPREAGADSFDDPRPRAPQRGRETPGQRGRWTRPASVSHRKVSLNRPTLGRRPASRPGSRRDRRSAATRFGPARRAGRRNPGRSGESTLAQPLFAAR
jgi:hypothetical protein